MSTTIKLDIDRKRVGRAPFRRLDFLCRVLRLHREAILTYRTANGWHILLFVRERVSPPIVVAMQAIAGSDWRRETFTLQKARRLHGVSRYWRERYNTLYEARKAGSASRAAHKSAH